MLFSSSTTITYPLHVQLEKIINLYLSKNDDRKNFLYSLYSIAEDIEEKLEKAEVEIQTLQLDKQNNTTIPQSGNQPTAISNNNNDIPDDASVRSTYTTYTKASEASTQAGSRNPEESEFKHTVSKPCYEVVRLLLTQRTLLVQQGEPEKAKVYEAFIYSVLEQQYLAAVIPTTAGLKKAIMDIGGPENLEKTLGKQSTSPIRDALTVAKNQTNADMPIKSYQNKPVTKESYAKTMFLLYSTTRPGRAEAFLPVDTEHAKAFFKMSQGK